MLQAILNGKLSSSQENMEDILTSCVFGSFNYLEPNLGLGTFLKVARGAETTDRPFATLDIKSVEYEFWPYWDQQGYENCEPDVVLKIDGINGQQLLILVEVKYQSGKSAYADEAVEAPTDQLAKEWDNLLVIAKAQGREPILLYVTADVVFPAQDIDDARREYEAKRHPVSRRHLFRCYWVSWRSLYQMFDDVQGELPADLRRLADKLGFKEFNGFSTPRGLSGIQWRYSTKYDWTVPRSPLVEWRFRR